MLLTTRRPSATIDGIFLVASFPDSIAILQSAVLRARISLTPSPVMATLCPFACKPSTRLFFCSGVTRPKTVYWLAAWCKSSSVCKVLASIRFSAPSMPAFCAIAETVAGLSPEMTLMVTPCCLK